MNNANKWAQSPWSMDGHTIASNIHELILDTLCPYKDARKHSGRHAEGIEMVRKAWAWCKERKFPTYDAVTKMCMEPSILNP